MGSIDSSRELVEGYGMCFVISLYLILLICITISDVIGPSTIVPVSKQGLNSTACFCYLLTRHLPIMQPPRLFIYSFIFVWKIFLLLFLLLVYQLIKLWANHSKMVHHPWSSNKLWTAVVCSLVKVLNIN